MTRVRIAASLAEAKQKARNVRDAIVVRNANRPDTSIVVTGGKEVCHKVCEAFHCKPSEAKHIDRRFLFMVDIEEPLEQVVRELSML